MRSATFRQQLPSRSSGTGTETYSTCQRVDAALAASDYVVNAHSPGIVPSHVVDNRLTAAYLTPASAIARASADSPPPAHVRRNSGADALGHSVLVRAMGPICFIAERALPRSLSYLAPRHPWPKEVSAFARPGLLSDCPQWSFCRLGHVTYGSPSVRVSGDIRVRGALNLSTVNVVRRSRHVLTTHYGRLRDQILSALRPLARPVSQQLH